MKVIGINGSPRKDWNTGTLINKMLEGAASKGADTKTIQLYELDYKGCKSCFSCRRKGSNSYGRCALKDELTPVLDEVADADALVLGSPLYIGSVTGEMKSFLERFIFPYLVYDQQRSSLFKKSLPIGLVFTMGAPEVRIKEAGYDQHFKFLETILKRMFKGSIETVISTDTCQFDDYSKYESSAFDPAEKAKRKQEIFPLDCQKAFEIGARLV